MPQSHAGPFRRRGASPAPLLRIAEMPGSYFQGCALWPFGTPLFRGKTSIGNLPSGTAIPTTKGYSHHDTSPRPSSFMLPVIVIAEGGSCASVRSMLVPRSLRAANRHATEEGRRDVHTTRCTKSTLPCYTQRAHDRQNTRSLNWRESSS